MTLFLQTLPRGLQRAFEIWAVGLAAAFSIYLSYYAVLLTHESYSYGDLSSGMVAVPIWIPQSAMTTGIIVLAIALADELFSLLRGQPASYDGKGENLLADAESVAGEPDATNTAGDG